MNSEESMEKTIIMINQDIRSERHKQISRVQEVVMSQDYQQSIRTFSGEFENKRKEFLTLLENQPGFLQSSFLGLHRKLRQKYQQL